MAMRWPGRVCTVGYDRHADPVELARGAWISIYLADQFFQGVEQPETNSHAKSRLVACDARSPDR